MAMTIYDLTMTEEQMARFGANDLEAVADRLDGLGYAVAGVSLRLRPSPAIVVDADRDPTADLADWTPPPNRDDLAEQVIRQTVQAIAAKAPANRTAMDRFALAIAWRVLRVGEET